MAQPSVSQLKEFQTKLNSSIDSYVAAIESNPEDPKATWKVDAEAQKLEGVVNVFAKSIRNPILHISEIGWQPIVNMSLRIAADLDLFNIVGSSITLDELVQKTTADRQLLFRLMRLLVSVSVFDEKQEKVYSSTRLSLALRLPPLRDLLKALFDSVLPIWQHTPGFLRENGYHDITSLKSNPTASLFDGKNFFESLAMDPAREADFASGMKIQENVPPELSPQYPFDMSKETFSKDADAVFIVDVGGGRGQVLERLAEKFPNMPGHNVLQDLPSVVVGASQEVQQKSNFCAMGHDFFQPQPIIGAKYYHLRVVLHDWPDEECIQILTHLRAAMKKGYSKVLVQDRVFAEMGVSSFGAMIDISMWVNCGRERTKRESRANFEKAGLRLSRIVKAQVGDVSVMECVRDDEEVEESV